MNSVLDSENVFLISNQKNSKEHVLVLCSKHIPLDTFIASTCWL
jgi:hypothetical protein